MQSPNCIKADVSESMLDSVVGHETPSNDESAAGKLCRVCGDKALGYNFNVMTCESCKAFFRRNALKEKPLVCHFAGKCEVNAVSRRFCQKCRLVKCFSAGMKKEAIMSEEALSDKRARLNSTKKYKRKEPVEPEFLGTPPKVAGGGVIQSILKEGITSAEPDFSVGSPFSPLSVSRGSPSVIQPVPHPVITDSVLIPRALLTSIMERCNDAMQLVAQTTFCTKCGDRLRAPPHVAPRSTGVSLSQVDIGAPSGLHVSPPSSYSNSPASLAQMVCNPGVVNPTPQLAQPASPFVALSWPPEMAAGPQPGLFGDNMSTVIDQAIASEFTECCPNMGLPQSSRVPGFTDVEQSRFDELLIANEVMNEPIDSIPESQLHSAVNSNPRLIDVINMTDIVIKRIIKMSKQLTGFQQLCQEDQISLLKGGCTEVMILRGVMRCDPEKNTWHGPFSQINMNILKEVKGRNFYEDHTRFIRTLKPSVRTCEPVMLLLGAICLFTPTRSNVVNAGDIKVEQDLYYSILNKYLDSIYTLDDARNVYSHVIQKIEDLHKLNDQAIRIFLDANPKDLEPLLIEIFDFNSKGNTK